jgi:hypothetical protein
LPIDHAKPALVVASASNPSDASSRAEPTSHGFGMTKMPSRACSSRKRSAADTTRRYLPQGSDLVVTRSQPFG